MFRVGHLRCWLAVRSCVIILFCVEVFFLLLSFWDLGEIPLNCSYLEIYSNFNGVLIDYVTRCLGYYVQSWSSSVTTYI